MVGIGEYTVSSNPGDSITAFALSTCIALTLYSSLRGILGMVHIALPCSPADVSRKSLGYYADTAVPLMMDMMCLQHGCKMDELACHIYGGARSKKEDDFFKIGERNIRAVKTSLSKYNMACDDRETGGVLSRTVKVSVATGEVRVQYNHIII